MSELDRRDFLKIVGLSAGAAATAGCDDPASKLIPYVVQPEEITPGIGVVYASTCQECPAACGLHVRTREGRSVVVPGHSYAPNDAFYEAKGSYNAFNTCNAWIGEGLRAAGVAASLWTPFSYNVTSVLRSH